MIIIRNATITFGDQTLFKNVSSSFSSKDKVGLFGLNGAGKSTLLKAIATELPLDSGTISVDQSKTIAYMPQEVVLQSDRSILDETLSADTTWWNTYQLVEQTKKNLDANPYNKLFIEQYENAYQQFFMYNPDHKKAEALKILTGLGFDTTTICNSVNSLSTGWKMRVVLAQLLFKKPDFYLFDEPTNHLDIVAKEWFLRFLKNSTVGFLMVCHEKTFLNALCSKICAIEHETITVYQGNYDHYIKNRDERIEALQDRFIVQQKEIEQMEKTINRFRASASKASFVQSMIKKLSKIERIILPPAPPKPHFSFPLFEKSGRTVLSVDNSAFEYNTKPVFHSISFTLERGMKLAIVAPNGGGKTTLIRLIQGILQSNVGSITWGEGVKKAFFDQDQVAALALDKTVFENAYSASEGQTTQTIRTFLGNFLFQGDDVKKKAGVLSGGERNRLGMVRVLLKKANTLILDEPTNHLDIPSKDILCEALKRFEGTILFVSHDQDFINQLATHVLELHSNKAVLFTGNYDDYLNQKEDSEKKIENTPFKKNHSKETRISSHSEKRSKEDEKKIRLYESQIMQLESKIQKKQNEFSDLEYGTAEFKTACEELQSLELAYKELLLVWEKIIC